MPRQTQNVAGYNHAVIQSAAPLAPSVHADEPVGSGTNCDTSLPGAGHGRVPEPARCRDGEQAANHAPPVQMSPLQEYQ